MRPEFTFFCELQGPALVELFADRSVLDHLRALDASVALGLLDLGDERAEVVRRLNAAGVPVVAWLLLSPEGGYWLHAENLEEAWARYGDFRAWSEREGLAWDRVGLDIEPDIHDVRQAGEEPWRLVGRLLPRLLGGAGVDRARESYQALVGSIRADGYPVDAYVIPLVHVEREAGSTLLQRLTRIVDLKVDREVPMLYTSFVRPHGVDLIETFAPHFPAAAVGLTGGGVVEGIERPEDLSWQELLRDVRLVLRHTPDVHVFSLEGCVERNWLRRLRRVRWGLPDPALLRRSRGVSDVVAWMDRALRVFRNAPRITALALVAVASAALAFLRLRDRR